MVLRARITAGRASVALLLGYLSPPVGGALAQSRASGSPPPNEIACALVADSLVTRAVRAHLPSPNTFGTGVYERCMGRASMTATNSERDLIRYFGGRVIVGQKAICYALADSLVPKSAWLWT
jgi:hypothetical protein